MHPQNRVGMKLPLAPTLERIPKTKEDTLPVGVGYLAPI